MDGLVPDPHWSSALQALWCPVFFLVLVSFFPFPLISQHLSVSSVYLPLQLCACGPTRCSRLKGFGLSLETTDGHASPLEMAWHLEDAEKSSSASPSKAHSQDPKPTRVPICAHPPWELCKASVCPAFPQECRLSGPWVRSDGKQWLGTCCGVRHTGSSPEPGQGASESLSWK